MSKQFKKLSHRIYECKYHIVCCPKYRHRIFKDEIKEYTKSQVYTKTAQNIFCDRLESFQIQLMNIKYRPVLAHMKVRSVFPGRCPYSAALAGPQAAGHA